MHFSGVATFSDFINIDNSVDPKYTQIRLKWIHVADVPYHSVSRNHPTIFDNNNCLRDGQEIGHSVGISILNLFPSYTPRLYDKAKNSDTDRVTMTAATEDGEV